MPFIEQPILASVLIADALYVDRDSGKVSILGSFTDLWFAEFPAVLPGFLVFLAITDGRGWGDLLIRVIDVDDEHEVSTKSVPIELHDPRTVLQFPIRIDRPEFPQAGEYRVQVLIDGNPLLERRITVRLKENSHGG